MHTTHNTKGHTKGHTTMNTTDLTALTQAHMTLNLHGDLKRGERRALRRALKTNDGPLAARTVARVFTRTPAGDEPLTVTVQTAAGVVAASARSVATRTFARHVRRLARRGAASVSDMRVVLTLADDAVAAERAAEELAAGADR